MNLIIPFDNSIYSLPKYHGYEERLKIVNYIIKKYEKLFNEYWEDTKNINGKWDSTTKTILDILGGYLYLSPDVKDVNILVYTNSQLYRKTNRTELPFGLDVMNKVKNFKEENLIRRPKLSLRRYTHSKTHKLTTIFIPKEKRLNKVFSPNHYYEYVFKIENNKLKIDKKYIVDQIKINCFTSKDLKLPYINKQEPYIAEWVCVDNDNIFNFNGDSYKITRIYPFDTILCFEQYDKKYFLDNNIELLKDNEITPHNNNIMEE